MHIRSPLKFPAASVSLKFSFFCCKLIKRNGRGIIQISAGSAGMSNISDHSKPWNVWKPFSNDMLKMQTIAGNKKQLIQLIQLILPSVGLHWFT